MEKGRYQRLVGKLIYLSHTRPDVGFVANLIGQLMNRPTKDHMDTIYRVLRYLKQNPGKGLFFKKSSIRDIKVYSEVDWARSHPIQIDVLLQGIVHLCGEI